MVFHLFERQQSKQNESENNIDTENNCNLIQHPIESNDIDVTMTNKLISESISFAAHSQYENQMKKMRLSTTINNDSNGNGQSVSSGLSIYIMFTLLFICICTTSVFLMVHINRVTDIERIRDGLKAEYLSKNDVQALVQNILNELRNKENKNLEEKEGATHSWNQR